MLPFWTYFSYFYSMDDLLKSENYVFISFLDAALASS